MIPNKHFYMIRHGETEANARDVCAGQMDTPLTELGKFQARAAGQIIAHLKIKPVAIFNSGLSRTRDTASIINQNLQLPMHENTKIAEQNFGDWVGMPYSKTRVLLGQGMEPPNGETWADCAQRVQAGIAEILTTAVEPVLIVCHGGSFHALGEAYDITLRGVKNCQLYEFVPHAEAAAFPWKIVKPTAVG